MAARRTTAPTSVTFAGSPTGPVQWQMGKGGDGFYARIDPVGTRNKLRGSGRATTAATSTAARVTAPPPERVWTDRTGGWTGDVQSFVLPYEIFKGDPSTPGNDCGPPGATTGCGHLVAGTVRVWETITGAAATPTWYVNSPANLTKQTLGNRSYINQLAFEQALQSTVIVGTNDGNVQIGRGLGTGSISPPGSTSPAATPSCPTARSWTSPSTRSLPPRRSATRPSAGSMPTLPPPPATFSK